MSGVRLVADQLPPRLSLSTCQPASPNSTNDTQRARFTPLAGLTARRLLNRHLEGLKVSVTDGGDSSLSFFLVLDFLLTSVLPWHPWAPPQMEALFGADYERITDDNAVDLEADVEDGRWEIR